MVSSNEELCTEGISGCITWYSTALPAEKRNIGARLAKGKYLAIFDDDVEILPGCIEEMVQLISYSPKIGMVYAKLHKFDETHRFDEAGGFLTNTGFIWSRAEQNIEDIGQYDKPEAIFAGKSAACLVRKYVWDKLGGMDEDFGILGEESDLSWRMWISGWEVWWCPRSVAEHKFNTRFKPVSKHYTNERVFKNGCHNYINMWIKNCGKEHLWIIPFLSLIWLSVAFVMIGTLKVTEGTSILKGLWSVIRNLRSTLRKREHLQDMRRVDESIIWPIISRTPRWSYYGTRLTRYISQGLHG